MKNPVYMGYPALGRRSKEEWTYAGKRIEELVIVSKEDWERAQKLREARKKRLEEGKEQAGQIYEKQGGAPFVTSGKLPLIGISYCGYCKKRLKNASYHNRWYSKREGKEKVSFAGRYQCPDKCVERYCYSQKYLEGIVFEVVEKYLENLEPVNLSEKIKSIQERKQGAAKRELEDLKKQLRETEQDIAAMDEKIPKAIRGDYIFSAEKLAGLIESRKRQQKELKRMILQKELEIKEKAVGERKIQDCGKPVLDWKKVFTGTDTPVKQMLLAALIERIEVKDGELFIRLRICREQFFGEKGK